MDRKARGICAGVLASLAAILSVGCGADSVPPSTSAQKAAPPDHSDLFAQDAVEVAQQALPSASDMADEVGSAPSEAVVVEPETYPEEHAWPSEADVAEMAPEESAVDDAAPAAVALEPAAQSGEHEPSGEVDLTAETDPAADVSEPAGEDESASENEIRFAGPRSEPSAAEAPSHDGGPRRSLIRMAIRPSDAATPDAGQSRGLAQSPAAPRSALTPIVIAPSAAPHEQTDAAQEPAIADAPAGPKSELKGVVVAPGNAPHELAPQVAEHPGAGEGPAAEAQQLPAPKPTRSPAMIATLARADERVRHGILLAQKGALYAARREFTTAIKLIAQANDVEHGTRQYTNAAIAGFMALKEANDLVGQYGGEGDVARITATHKTKVLQEAELVDMLPSVAAGYYYDYARQQLGEAIGRQTVGSIALYGLGKIIVIGAGPNSQQLEYTGPAIALYQAALMAEPENFRAAHELGVLLASAGQLEMARELLIASASKSPQPTIWRNLAALHSRMGEPQLAAQAQQRADALNQTTPESKAPQVDWVDPATFATTAHAGELTPRAATPKSQTPTTTPQAASEPTESKAGVARRRSNEWNPLNLRR
jgi:tetratricopeptide (TPR) repeat protein